MTTLYSMNTTISDYHYIYHVHCMMKMTPDIYQIMLIHIYNNNIVVLKLQNNVHE